MLVASGGQDSPGPSPRRWLRSKVASAAVPGRDVVSVETCDPAPAYGPYYRAYLLQKEPKHEVD
jgi:hypothetical protein